MQIKIMCIFSFSKSKYEINEENINLADRWYNRIWKS